MEQYDNAFEKFKDVDSKRENVDLDDFEEFMRKVEEVNKMVHALASNNKSEIEEASQHAEDWLRIQKREKSVDKEMVEEIIHEPSGYSKNPKKIYNKTVINEKPFTEEKKNENLDNMNCETMSPEAFMKSVEEDVKKRSEDRKQRKLESDVLKENAKKAFLLGDYEKALDCYNKVQVLQAIEVRKDCCALYTNRALTLLNLGLNSRALKDCETALKLDEENFKAVMYKGKAYFQMGEEEKAEECIMEAVKMFPNRKPEIEEYQKSWQALSETEEN